MGLIGRVPIPPLTPQQARTLLLLLLVLALAIAAVLLLELFLHLGGRAWARLSGRPAPRTSVLGSRIADIERRTGRRR